MNTAAHLDIARHFGERLVPGGSGVRSETRMEFL